jgi:CHAD domain-containing protein
MRPAPKSADKSTRYTERTQQPRARLHSTMACDTAFRVVARGCLRDLTANRQATYKGAPEALHQMRIALTRLRTAISFFSPMVADQQRARIRRELKWLHTHLGAVRDLDVAIERLRDVKRRAQARSDHLAWKAKRTESQRHLARALRSVRYQRLVERITGWIENGPWSTEAGKQAAQRRSRSIASYSACRLARWQKKLLKKSRKLQAMSAKKRHRLRLINKKLYYSIELVSDLNSGKRSSTPYAALRYLRRAQKSLGQLNDDARGQALAVALERDGVRSAMPRLGRGRERLLMQDASKAYRKLASLKPIKIKGHLDRSARNNPNHWRT